MNIIKIDNVQLHVGFTETGFRNCFDCNKLLLQHKIKPDYHQYCNSIHFQQHFTNLSTWSFGMPSRQVTIVDFPIVFWAEHYETGMFIYNVALSVDELHSSNLIKYKELYSG